MYKSKAHSTRCVGGSGVGILVFYTYVRLAGFWQSIFQIFFLGGGGGGIFAGSPTTNLGHFGGLFEVNVQNGNNFWGMLKFLILEGGGGCMPDMPVILIIFFFLGGGGQMLCPQA